MSVVMVELETLYQCGRCGTPKAPGDFSPDRRGPDGRVTKRDSICKACRRKAKAARSGATVMRAKAYREPASPTLPSEPFRSWLRGRLVREGAWDPIGDRAIAHQDREGRSIKSLATEWGVSEKRIRDLMAGCAVTLSIADKIFTRSGFPHLLAECYPEIDDLLGVTELDLLGIAI